jgi:hypothetical protein
MSPTPGLPERRRPQPETAAFLFSCLLPLPFVLDNPSRVRAIGDTSYVTIKSHVIADSNDFGRFRGQDGSVAMTLQQDHTDVGRRHTPPVHTPRLRLKPKAPQSGYVDGAWWPHSEDLTAELPDLLSVLSVRLGPITRVIYNINEWAKPPAKLVTGGRTVRLDGYRRQPVNTVEVLGLNRNKIVLLAVSPQAHPDQAHAIMMTAAGPDNASSVDSLLKISAEDGEAPV